MLLEFKGVHPDVLVLVAPPLYRLKPEWYHDHLPEILLQFSKFMSPLQKEGVHLLPSFSGTDVEDETSAKVDCDEQSCINGTDADAEQCCINGTDADVSNAEETIGAADTDHPEDR